jgi:hypothetical protein
MTEPTDSNISSRDIHKMDSDFYALENQITSLNLDIRLKKVPNRGLAENELAILKSKAKALERKIEAARKQVYGQEHS